MTNAKNRHHGLALMIVIAAVAMGTLIALAMLSNASLQAQVAGNLAAGVQGDYLAESGAQIATYYLQRDLSGMPSSWAGHTGYALQASGLTVTGVTGSFDISAAAGSQPDTYSISSVGHSGGASSMGRTITGTVKVVRATPNYSGGFGGAVSVPTKVYFNGGSFVANGSVVGSGTPNISGGIKTSFQSTDFTVPTTGQVNKYGGTNTGTYTMPDGTTGRTQAFNNDITIATPLSLVAASTNPGHVFYVDGDVTIIGGGNYDATIIANGKVTIQAVASTVNFTRKSGFPAIVTQDQFKINGALTNVNVYGVVYAAKGVAWGSALAVTGTTVKINGALLVPSTGAPLGAPNTGTLIVNYTPANNDILNMTTTVATPIAVKYSAWAQ